MKKLNLKALKVESFITTPEEKEIKGGRPPLTWAPEKTCIASYCFGVCISINVAC